MYSHCSTCSRPVGLAKNLQGEELIVQKHLGETFLLLTEKGAFHLPCLKYEPTFQENTGIQHLLHNFKSLLNCQYEPTGKRNIIMECPISMETIKENMLVLPPCGHPISLENFLTLMKGDKKKCPICRSENFILKDMKISKVDLKCVRIASCNPPKSNQRTSSLSLARNASQSIGHAVDVNDPDIKNWEKSRDTRHVQLSSQYIKGIQGERDTDKGNIPNIKDTSEGLISHGCVLLDVLTQKIGNGFNDLVSGVFIKHNNWDKMIDYVNFQRKNSCSGMPFILEHSGDPTLLGIPGRGGYYKDDNGDLLHHRLLLKPNNDSSTNLTFSIFSVDIPSLLEPSESNMVSTSVEEFEKEMQKILFNIFENNQSIQEEYDYAILCSQITYNRNKTLRQLTEISPEQSGTAPSCIVSITTEQNEKHSYISPWKNDNTLANVWSIVFIKDN